MLNAAEEQPSPKPAASRLPPEGPAESVIPAEAGIQLSPTPVDPRLRGDDRVRPGMTWLGRCLERLVGGGGIFALEGVGFLRKIGL